MPHDVKAGANPDTDTAAAFTTSWNTVGEGSVYTWEQFVDWFAPLEPSSFAGQRVLELGFGNGSQLFHMGKCGPAHVTGVELGDTHEQTRKNLRHLPEQQLELVKGDLTKVDLGQFDLVYCIGVLHHLQEPERGFEAVLRHTRPGGRFHCWIYAEEGNAVVVRLVDPVRKVASRLPWWFTKYGVALSLVAPYFVYAKALRWMSEHRGARKLVDKMPLGAYSVWIARREFSFFHHVAFDQLVTPRTVYIRRATVDAWLRHPDVDPASVYIEHRNGNSWKFGGRKRAE